MKRKSGKPKNTKKPSKEESSYPEQKQEPKSAALASTSTTVKNKKKNTNSTPTSSASSSSSSSLQIGRIYYIFAVLSFIAGIYTPPLYTHFVANDSKSISKVKPNTADESPTTQSSTIATTNISTSSSSSNNSNSESNSKTEQNITPPKVEKKQRDNQKRPSSYKECNAENLSQFLHDEPMRGLHVLCFPFKQEKEEGGGGEMTFYKYAYNSTDVLHKYPLSNSFDDLKQVLKEKLDIEMYDSRLSEKQPWAIYSSNGQKLVGELASSDRRRTTTSTTATVDAMNTLQTHGMVLLYEGGSWLWPGVRIGFKRTIKIHDKGDGTTTKSKRKITIETLSLYPLVLSVPDFIHENECTHVQKKAEPSMKYSEVTLMDKDLGRPSSDFRTSQSAFISANDDDIMLRLEHRTSSLTRLPRSHQEYTQVLRYGNEEKYSAHLDWFDKTLYQQDPNTLKLINHGKRNRLATVFWYLSDVEEGGHTVFPRFGKAPQPYDFDDCTKGLLVKPQRGKVIIFYSLTADGKGDPLSLHGACAVKEGIKWAANKWVWNSPMGFV